jgi:pentatricopeptide repeat protein
MAKRYESGTSDVSPDSATYTTTINAWARSREIDAVERAEEILEMCEESFKLGNIHAKPNTLTYNSMINCYSKSRLGASDKALAMLQSMKERSQAGAEWCSPDVVTYTSVIDTLAKEQTAEATEMAEKLLEELENANLESPDHERLKPNIRTYTSVRMDDSCRMGYGLLMSFLFLFQGYQRHRTQWEESRKSRSHSGTFGKIGRRGK